MSGLLPFGGGSFAGVEEFGPDVIEINESLVIGLTPDSYIVFALIEQLSLNASTTETALVVIQLAEVFRLDQRLVPILTVLINEPLVLDASLAATPVYIVALIDSLIISGVADNTVTAMALLSDAIAFADNVRRIQEQTITNAIDFADAFDIKAVAWETLVTEATFSDTALGLSILTVVVDESFNVSAGTTLLQTIIASIHDGIGFSVGFTFEGVPYLGIAMNATTKGISEYTNFEFNSLTNFQGGANATGRLFGACETGLYLLEGDDDAGTAIDWRIRTGLSKLGIGKEKKISSAYLGFSGDGKLLLKVVVNKQGAVARGERGELAEYWYQLTETPSGGAVREGRIKIGRGLKSVYYAFELCNLDDNTANTTLDGIYWRPLQLDRRIP